MLINSQDDMVVIGEASNVLELWKLLSTHKADVILLDIGLPRTTGLQALMQLREKHPSVRVLMLSMHRDMALVRSAVAAGAAGFVCKEAADAELLGAIRSVQRGGVFLDPYMTKQLLPVGRAPRIAPQGALSDRERQIIKLIARGYSNQEIADGIQISVKTVETYRARIAEKLGVRTRTQIARYAFASGLVSTEDFLDDKWIA